MLASQAQQTVLAISSHLINLISFTGDAYIKTLKLKVYSDTVKKHLLASWTTPKQRFFILLCFKQLVSIAYISKWDSMVFGKSIAMPTD